MYTLAVDAMGGDFAPKITVKGCLEALRAFDDIRIRLFGREEEIRPHLSGEEYDAARLKILDARDVITNDEAPMLAVRHKTDSSLVRAAMDVRQGNADALISAGSTGAVLACGMLRIGRIAGVDRPALAAIVPTVAGVPAVIVDAGANVDCRPEYLLRFAQMGDIYARQVLGIQNPRVGLLNIGEEEEKGCQLTKATHELLKTAKLNFTGNVEARGVLNGGADVFVCDGYHGNLVIKASEGAIAALFTMLKRELTSTFVSKVGAALSKPAFRRVKRRMNVNEVGGGPMLGVRGAVVKAHGNSTSHAFFCCLRQARQMAAGQVVEIIEKLDEQIEGGNENV